jgi:hypothetical protein
MQESGKATALVKIETAPGNGSQNPVAMENRLEALKVLFCMKWRRSKKLKMP